MLSVCIPLQVSQVPHTYMSVVDAVLCCPAPLLGQKDLPPQLLGRLLADGSAVNPLQELPSAEGSHTTRGSMLSPKVICSQWLGDVGGQGPGSLAPT